MSETAHPKLDLAFRLAKRFVFDPVVEIELAALFIEAPYLNVWPVRQVITSTAHMITDRFYAGFKKIVDVNALPFINAQHEKLFNSEFTRLMLLGDSLGDNSEEFKKAEEEAHDAFIAVIRYNATK